MHVVSPTFAAIVAAYQVLCSDLDALQEHNILLAELPWAAPEDDELTASLRLVRLARIARSRLRELLCDQVGLAIRSGQARAAIVDHVRSDLDTLMTQRLLRPDPELVDEIVAWVLEAYPGERSKADYAETA